MTNVTPEYVTEIIEKFEVSDENKQRGVMGIEGNCPSFLFLLFNIFSFIPFLFIFTFMTKKISFNCFALLRPGINSQCISVILIKSFQPLSSVQQRIADEPFH